MSETTVVALIGTVATVLVALAGIVANLIQSRSATRQQESVRRYNELVEFYTGVANEMYDRVRRMIIAALDSELDGDDAESIERSARAKIVAHLQDLKGDVTVSPKLKLYGAPPRVIDAWLVFDEGMSITDYSRSGIAAWSTQQEANLEAFLDEAGMHTASVRPRDHRS
jgi:hypothetical protein